MARRATSRTKAVPVVTGKPLPTNWRIEAVRTWGIWAMMAKIPPSDYETTARAFEAHHRWNGTLSDDWLRAWKDWCNAILYRRGAVERVAVSEPEFGPGMFG